MELRKRIILTVAIALLFLSNGKQGTSYGDVKTEIETYMLNGKRFFKFLPNGNEIPREMSIDFFFTVYENNELKYKMWEFNSFFACREGVDAGVIEYGKIRNNYCFVDYCKIKDNADLYGSKKKCLDKILFNSISLEAGVEYAIELKSPHKGRFIFVH